jgi:hypothetical protein
MMKITVLLDQDPLDGGDTLTLMLMEALAEAGHDVDCLITDDELGEDIVKGGVRHHHITFSGAFPALDSSGPQLILSSGETATHAIRMAGYLDTSCAAVILDDSPESHAVVNAEPVLLVYASEYLRRALPPGEVPSLVVLGSDELTDFVKAVQDVMDDVTF